MTIDGRGIHNYRDVKEFLIEKIRYHSGGVSRIKDFFQKATFDGWVLYQKKKMLMCNILYFMKNLNRLLHALTKNFIYKIVNVE